MHDREVMTTVGADRGLVGTVHIGPVVQVGVLDADVLAEIGSAAGVVDVASDAGIVVAADRRLTGRVDTAGTTVDLHVAQYQVAEAEAIQVAAGDPPLDPGSGDRDVGALDGQRVFE